MPVVLARALVEWPHAVLPLRVDLGRRDPEEAELLLDVEVYDSPAIRKIQAHIRKVRAES